MTLLVIQHWTIRLSVLSTQLAAIMGIPDIFSSWNSSLNAAVFGCSVYEKCPVQIQWERGFCYCAGW
jgi:hypothetical protein